MTDNDKDSETSPDEKPRPESSLNAPGGRSPGKSAWIAVILIAVVLGLGGLVWYQAGNKEPGPDSSSSREPVPIEAQQDRDQDRKSEDKEFSADTVLATVNQEKIRVEDLNGLLNTIPESQRKNYEKDRPALLELVIKRTVLLQKAEQQDAATTTQSQNAEDGTAKEKTEDERISELLSGKVLNDVQVQEQELRRFYEENKEQMPKDSSFEQVKGQIQNYVLQMKQQQAIDDYITGLMDKASITRNQDWIDTRKASMADNPLARALQTNRPVLADFGRGSCVPCKMMEPILEELQKKYKGKAEILILDVGEYPVLTRESGIRAIPTQIFYDAAGNEVKRHQGFMDKESIVKELEKL